MHEAMHEMSRGAVSERVDPAYFRRNLRIYYLFMASTGFMVFLPVWIIYLINERGLTLTEVGVFEAFFFLTVIIAEVPTGAIADRFGRRISLALGALLFAISMVIFALASHFTILLASYLLLGIGMTLYSGASEALLYDTLRVLGRTSEYEHHAGRSQGLFWAMMVVATAVGGPLAYLLGYSPAMMLSSGFFLIAGAAALMLREPPRRESDYPPDPLHAPPASVSHTAEDATAAEARGIPIWYEMIEGVRTIWRIRPVRYLVPFAALLIALFDMPRFLTQPYVAQHGLDPLTSVSEGMIWSALLLPAYLGTMVGMLSSAKLLARVGERRSFPIILVFGAVFMIPLAIWNQLGLLGAIFMVSIAQAALRPITTGYINRRISSDQRATALSIFSLVGGAAMSIVLLTIVPTADLVSYEMAFAMALLVVVTLGVALWLLWRWSHVRDQTERIRRWSISAPKPQAPRIERSDPDSETGSDGGLFPSVQNLD